MPLLVDTLANVTRSGKLTTNFATLIIGTVLIVLKVAIDALILKRR